MTEAVADAGPLIHLHEIGGLGLLEVFSRLHVPEVVWAEAVGTGRVPQAAAVALKADRHGVDRARVAAFIKAHGLSHLHAGERDCLYLCMRERSVPVILTDDLAVRKAA